MFTNLKKAFIQNREERRAETIFYINNGYTEHWNPDAQKLNDEGIRKYSTARRWDQYSAGEISREKAIQYATTRYNKKMDEEIAAGLQKLDRIAAAPDVNYININIIWKRSKTWGYNPHARAFIGIERQYYEGSASGCGYDKRSTAAAEALNQSDAVIKILCDLKEKALEEGISDHSGTACTGVNNTACIGYGAGYSTIPYFEGGVGIDCFINIFKKAGFTINTYSGDIEENYQFTKEYIK